MALSALIFSTKCVAALIGHTPSPTDNINSIPTQFLLKGIPQLYTCHRQYKSLALGILVIYWSHLTNLWAGYCLPVHPKRIRHLPRQCSFSFEVCPDKDFQSDWFKAQRKCSFLFSILICCEKHIWWPLFYLFLCFNVLTPEYSHWKTLVLC